MWELGAMGVGERGRERRRACNVRPQCKGCFGLQLLKLRRSSRKACSHDTSCKGRSGVKGHVRFGNQLYHKK